jgi:hypothetical protein
LQGQLDVSVKIGRGTFSADAGTNRRINGLYHAHLADVEAAGVSSVDAPMYLIMWTRGASYVRAVARLLSGLDDLETHRARFPYGHFLVRWLAMGDIPADALDAATAALPGHVPFAQWRSGLELAPPCGRALVRLFGVG